MVQKYHVRADLGSRSEDELALLVLVEIFPGELWEVAAGVEVVPSGLVLQAVAVICAVKIDKNHASYITVKCIT